MTYRVEWKLNSGNQVILTCEDKDLEETKKLVKAIQEESGRGKAFYREFPLTRSKKIYF